MTNRQDLLHVAKSCSSTAEPDKKYKNLKKSWNLSAKDNETEGQ